MLQREKFINKHLIKRLAKGLYFPFSYALLCCRGYIFVSRKPLEESLETLLGFNEDVKVVLYFYSLSIDFFLALIQKKLICKSSQPVYRFFQAAKYPPSRQADVLLQLLQTRSPTCWEVNDLLHIKQLRSLINGGWSGSGLLVCDFSAVIKHLSSGILFWQIFY